MQVLNTVDDEDRVLGWLAATVRTAWRSHLRPRLAERIRHQLLDAAAQHATEVFASNLRDILLAAPAGHKTTLGLDPGLRHGVKYAVVDGTGEPLRVGTVYPHAPRNQWAEALRELAASLPRARRGTQLPLATAPQAAKPTSSPANWFAPCARKA